MKNDKIQTILNTASLNELNSVITTIMDIPDETLNSESLEVMMGMINGGLTPSSRNTAVNNIFSGFKADNLSKTEAINTVNVIKETMRTIIDELNPGQEKRQLLEFVFKLISDMFEEAIIKLINEHIIQLQVKLDEGAKMPTYAHKTDAAADLYAADTITLPAHSLSNMVRTGVHIILPEGYMAMIFPRSSIGAKTGLRLSNSAGIIDQAYLGQLGVLYDNVSDSDYTINAGDRIAQLLILPSYQFKAEEIQELPETDRNESGFGSTGK